MTTRRIFSLFALVALVAIGIVAYSLFRAPQEATGPVEAPTVVLPTATTTAAQALPQAPDPTATPIPQDTPIADTPAPTPESVATGPILFAFDQNRSEARFVIDEVLRSAPKTVVGVTNQVAGQIAVDVANPSASIVGEILINARTLTTDNDFRNRAIKNQILRTDAFEFVSFKPAALIGLPASVAVGDVLSFQITGDLTVTDVTLPVTFDVSMQVISETRLDGLASAAIRWADFGLRIPDSPQVDTVADDLRLELQFTALPIE